MFKSAFHHYKNRCLVFLFFVVSIGIIISCNSNPPHKEIYVIARSPNWRGLTFFGSTPNVLGFSDDLLLKIAHREGFEVQFITTDAPPLPLLDQGSADGILSSLIPTPENEQIYIFSNPYFMGGPVLVVRQNSSFSSIHDLANTVIGYERGSNWDFYIPDKAQVTFQPYDTIDLAIEDLENNNIDGVVMNADLGYRLTYGLFKNILRVAGPPLQPAYLRLIVAKGKSDELIALFNKGLLSIKKDGLYNKMLKYWGLFSAEEVLPN